MRSIARDCRVLQNAEGTSVEDYLQRFNRYKCVDFVYAIIFGAVCVIEFAGSDISEGEFSGSVSNVSFVNKGIPGLISLLFMVDGALMVIFTKHINEHLQNPGSCALSSLTSETNLNLVTNTVSSLTYAGWRVAILFFKMSSGSSSSIPSSVLVFTVLIAILVLVSKLTKVLVITAFRRRLSAGVQISAAALVTRDIQVERHAV
eukprot:TRINITY_DN11138_c0_g2_i1.p1 TRINITY_DN11138_c0_g2~~TRINITY_DN11138_c0_g2_i1.p1  ORF type:complete len:204 (-),score=12.19 TRINITY_DN11138_c0_g2_i1:281-892(-)